MIHLRYQIKVKITLDTNLQIIIHQYAIFDYQKKDALKCNGMKGKM